ncbi:MAG: NADPH-dependent glutamate synthase [Anaerolineae bacterium]|nr:NADPH-dependent glutamate synthase [Anaerolineae bacterium]MCX8068058.1 NADPH-dependent glutamate synthase [Anaerolineae bacterium]MDW7992596.1 NADPH-dependent glutamate synthase [Anaerolineae bacterium]
MTPLTQRERLKIPRQKMPEQDPIVRRGNFNEVALGFTEELAIAEANRCLQCARPGCVDGCPVGVLIPQFIRALREGDIEGAVAAMKVKNSLPAICGRVCPQETQCEVRCVLARKGEPVAIGRLERYVGDYELAMRTCPLERKPPTGRKVAIVGTGPAGLTCAVDVAREGHEVVMFESLHAPGGVLIYGIPEFRLPKSVVQAEIDYAVECLGIRIYTDYVIGRTLTLKDLLDEYDAVFLGTGAGLPTFMRIPGINYNGVMSANEFLTRVNLMKGYLFPEYDTPVKVGRKVAVIGAGNVAMDAARCALRLQTLQKKDGEVHIVYRRSRDEVPARAEEVHHAEEEGIIFDFLTNPVEILGDAKGNVVGMRCIRMTLGEPDASGRRSPIPIPGSEFEMEVDMVIFALGTSPNPLVFMDAEGLQRTKHGTVVVKDEETGRTTMPRVWAGGDVVTGAATVVSAMGAGKRAAADINRFLSDGRGEW